MWFYYVLLGSDVAQLLPDFQHAWQDLKEKLQTSARTLTENLERHSFKVKKGTKSSCHALFTHQPCQLLALVMCRSAGDVPEGCGCAGAPGMCRSAGDVPEGRGCAGAPGMCRSAGGCAGAPGMCRSAGGCAGAPEMCRSAGGCAGGPGDVPEGRGCAGGPGDVPEDRGNCRSAGDVPEGRGCAGVPGMCQRCARDVPGMCRSARSAPCSLGFCLLFELNCACGLVQHWPLHASNMFPKYELVWLT